MREVYPGYLQKAIHKNHSHPRSAKGKIYPFRRLPLDNFYNLMLRFLCLYRMRSHSKEIRVILPLLESLAKKILRDVHPEGLCLAAVVDGVFLFLMAQQMVC